MIFLSLLSEELILLIVLSRQELEGQDFSLRPQNKEISKIVLGWISTSQTLEQIRNRLIQIALATRVRTSPAHIYIIYSEIGNSFLIV
jgi:hypothetical protein